MTATERTAYTNGMRALADLYDAHPELRLPYGAGTALDHHALAIYTHGVAQFLDAAEALHATPAYDHDGQTVMVATLDGLHILVKDTSGEVCRRRRADESDWVVDPAVAAYLERVEAAA